MNPLKHSKFLLINPCAYSFMDLYKVSFPYLSEKEIEIQVNQLKKLPQPTINEHVKMMCDLSGWYWKDTIGFDGHTVFTSFSKEIVVINEN